MIADTPFLNAQSGLRELDSSLSSSSLLESVIEEDPIMKQFAYESDLKSSRVYQRSNWQDDGTFSVNTTSPLTTGRSLLSGLSLGDVSNISIIAIPIYAEDTTNKHIYQFDSRTKLQAQDALEASRPENQGSRRKILLASLEYTIEDWNIKNRDRVPGRTGSANSQKYRSPRFDMGNILCWRDRIPSREPSRAVGRCCLRTNLSCPCILSQFSKYHLHFA